MQRSFATSDDALPISEALFSRILRSPPHAVAELTRDLSDAVRARLALHFNARAHLRDAALVVAASCNEQILLHEGGQAGKLLFAQSRARSGGSIAQSRLSARSITLAGVTA